VSILSATSSRFIDAVSLNKGETLVASCHHIDVILEVFFNVIIVQVVVLCRVHERLSLLEKEAQKINRNQKSKQINRRLCSVVSRVVKTTHAPMLCGSTG